MAKVQKPLPHVEECGHCIDESSTMNLPSICTASIHRANGHIWRRRRLKGLVEILTGGIVVLGIFYFVPLRLVPDVSSMSENVKFSDIFVKAS